MNHMAGLGRAGTGSGGSSFNSDNLDFSGVPFSNMDFTPRDLCPSSNGKKEEEEEEEEEEVDVRTGKGEKNDVTGRWSEDRRKEGREKGEKIDEI